MPLLIGLGFAPSVFDTINREAPADEGPKYSVQLMTGAIHPPGVAVPPKSVVMTKKDGKRYRCYLPSEGGAPSAADESLAAPTPHIATYLRALKGTCFYRLEGWWTYEFCLLKAVRQFHQEKVKTASRADATRAFRDAGAVVVLGDLVYLDGAQVTKDILRALPAVPGAVYGLDPETLAELESEMAAIQVDVDAAAARAARRSNAIVFGGLVLLCAQLATFVRLTYVELSWDVMEPISYFVGVFNAILLYVYFMVNQRDFSFDDWSKRMRAHFRRRNIERARVDTARYAALARRLGKKRGG